MDKLNEYREAFRELPDGCKSAEVNLIIKDYTEVTCSKGEITDCSASERNMLFIRATGEATGTVYCENLEEDPYKLIKTAMENASVVSSGKPQPMLENHHDMHVMEQTSKVSTEEMIQRAKEISLLEGIENCTVSSCIRESIVLNSLGTETLQIQPIYDLSIDVFGKGENNYKTKLFSRKKRMI